MQGLVFFLWHKAKLVLGKVPSGHTTLFTPWGLINGITRRTFYWVQKYSCYYQCITYKQPSDEQQLALVAILAFNLLHIHVHACCKIPTYYCTTRYMNPFGWHMMKMLLEGPSRSQRAAVQWGVSLCSSPCYHQVHCLTVLPAQTVCLWDSEAVGCLTIIGLN